ncbi:UDP-glucuronosyltransferase 2C1-like [Diadema antillarum]|uniref:UDP-glucuronosyltransferase 2C1-like n=1 Tax=Diadema antillarum TaxID=105358 RepID=UPI003A84B6DA
MYSEKQTDGDFSLLSALARGLVKNGHCVTALVSDCHYEELNDDTAYSHLKFDVFADSTTTFVRKNPFRSPSRRCLHSQTFNSGVSMTRHQQTIAGSLTRCSFLLDHVLTQRNQRVRYDLLIVDAHKGCSILLAGVLDVPYILVVPRGIEPSLSRRVGAPDTTAYFPEISSGLSHKMNFRQRVFNTISSFYEDLSLFIANDVYLFLFNFKYEIRVPINHVISNAQLVLINSDFAIDFPFPLAPNAVAVGGLTTRDPKPLDEDWMELISPTGEGVVLVTLGTKDTSAGAKSGIQISDLTKLSRAFAAIPQLIVWQMKEEPPASLQLSSNIRIVKWMPQNDLLGHQSLKALVFHGGNNGMYEALYHGVPMVVMPLIYDHPDVAARVVDRGMGVVVDFFSFTSEELTLAIQTVINNSSYRHHTQRVSAIFKAHPQPPLERAAFWIEHVMKYGGDYLRSSRTDLYIWQVYSLDVYAFLLLLVYLSYRVLKFCVVRRYHRHFLAAIFTCLKLPLRCLSPLGLRHVIGSSIGWGVAGRLRKRWTSSSVVKV